MPGKNYDTMDVSPRIKGIVFDALLADEAFDIRSIIDGLTARGAQVVISQCKNRIEKREVDYDVYRSRHLIENFFAKLKEFKRIAMRSEKTDRSFTAMILPVAAAINSR